jgi:hypothetical protein
MGVLWGALYRTGMASRGGGRGETAVASGAPLGWLRILPPPPLIRMLTLGQTCLACISPPRELIII